MNIYEIKYGDYTAKINASRGANCISLRHEKYQCCILREPDYAKELDNPYLYGMPILFPVNRISGGLFTFEGRRYEFPINEPKTNCFLHGTLHETEFQLLEKEEHRVQLSYIAEKPYIYHFFPHAFEICMEYVLDESGLQQRTEVKNLSKENMPVFLGFHTTFSIPFVQGGIAEDVRVLAEVGDEIERDMSTYLPTGRILGKDELSEQFLAGDFVPLEKSISKHYKAIQSGKIELAEQKHGLKVVYENDRKFGWRLFYNGEAEAYICLEPQTCMANCQNAPFDRTYAGFDYIEPQKSKTYVSKISILEN